MKFRKTAKKSPLLELTPLVDVVFLLLTFYMLTSTFNKDEGLPLELPNSTSSTTQQSKSISVSVIDQQSVKVDDSTISIIQLSDYLKPKLSEETSVVVRSNKGSQVQDLVSVLDQIQQAGGKSVSIATTKEVN